METIELSFLLEFVYAIGMFVVGAIITHVKKKNLICKFNHSSNNNESFNVMRLILSRVRVVSAHSHIVTCMQFECNSCYACQHSSRSNSLDLLLSVHGLGWEHTWCCYDRNISDGIAVNTNLPL